MEKSTKTRYTERISFSGRRDYTFDLAVEIDLEKNIARIGYFPVKLSPYSEKTLEIIEVPGELTKIVAESPMIFSIFGERRGKKVTIEKFFEDPDLEVVEIAIKKPRPVRKRKIRDLDDDGAGYTFSETLMGNVREAFVATYLEKKEPKPFFAY